MSRPTLVLIVRRDLTVPEFGVAVAHACEAMLHLDNLEPDAADVVLKGARNEEALLWVEHKLKEQQNRGGSDYLNALHYAFREEAASPTTGERFRLGGQLVSIGIVPGPREVVLNLPALEGVHALESLDGPKEERPRCEGRWAGEKFPREEDGSLYRCRNLCAPGAKFCAKKACAERRQAAP